MEAITDSEESSDAMASWTEFFKEEKSELPKFQFLRRRELAIAKLRTLIRALDDRAIFQLREEDMEGYVVAGGEDDRTGFLFTARRLGKKAPKEDREDDELANATARVKHMEMSKELVSILQRMVYTHNKQLKGAILTLTKQQMDRILRRNHEKFSGTHKQKGQGEGNGSKRRSPSKRLDHEFATARVKSAAKSREAVSLLNQVVGEKDNLLRHAIQSMERKEIIFLTSKISDFLKWEAQRAKKREDFRQANTTRTVSEHPHATTRVRHEARAKMTLKELKERVQTRRKALTTLVKRIPKPQIDSFVQKVNGVTKHEGIVCKPRKLSAPSARTQKTNLDTTRYARAEVMALSRRVRADVQQAIQAKDDELEKMVAMMDEEEHHALADFGTTGKEDINLWKRDRRKRSWQRLSAFGMVRNDPSLYRQWKQQRHQRVASQAEGRNTESILGTTCATDVMRRKPWSMDLNYSHRLRAQQQHPAKNHHHHHQQQRQQQQQQQQRVLTQDLVVSSGGNSTTNSGRLCRNSVHTAPSSRNLAGQVPRTRPASAPVSKPSRPDQPESARTPSLAMLARVFYQSSVASAASILGERSTYRRPSRIECLSQATRELCENGYSEGSPRPETNDDEESKVDSEAEKVTASAPQGEREQVGDKLRPSDLGAAEKRMESVHLLWAVSQLSTDAVTKKVMHGYSERQRAREPNRTQRIQPSRRPQPPASPRTNQASCRRGRRNSAGRRFVAHL